MTERETEMEKVIPMKPVERVSKLKGDLVVRGPGVVLPQNMDEVTQFAQYMAKADEAIPKHLRLNPGMCMSVIMDSISWSMNPFSVARMHMVVNGVGSYMAQLIAAVVKAHAPIMEKVIPYKFTGEGGDLQCSITVHHAETGEEITYTSPKKKDIAVQNSPLWKSDPQQQLGYFTIRALARRHFPEILLGVYDREEVLAMKDITPKTQVDNFLEDKPEQQMGVDLASGPDKSVTVVVDRETGEIIDVSDIPEQGEEFFEKAKLVTPGDSLDEKGETQVANEELEGQPQEAPPEPVAPEVIAANMEGSIKASYDKKFLEALQARIKSDITALPGVLAARVRETIRERLKAIEGEEL